jgi:hypothetical protein
MRILLADGLTRSLRQSGYRLRQKRPGGEFRIAQPWSVYFRNNLMRNTEMRIAYTYVNLRKTQIRQGRSSVGYKAQ